MPKSDLELAAHFVAALYAATRGRPGQFRMIDDCARRSGIKRQADVDRAVQIAEAAGFLVQHVDEPRVMLTTAGRQSVQPGKGGRR